MQFEWDANKARSNLIKHGISFDDASTVFGDPCELTISDPEHSFGEFRYISIGKSESGRTIVVSYTEREPYNVRIISARLATKKELRFYEQSK